MTTSGPIPTAMAVLELAERGRFAEIRDMFAPTLRAMVSAEALRAGWAVERDRLGPLSAGTPTSEPADAGRVSVRVPLTGQRGVITALVTVDDAGRLYALQLLPGDAAEPVAPWAPPDYADPDTFDEHEVTLGTGPLAVPGTLSVPRQAGPLPAVVLLLGSGAHDRDETLGRNKPFKDLAWGLASRGVVVARYDKLTYAHRDQLVGTRDFTPTREYVPDAVAAVDVLRRHPAVDQRRIFVLGHSMGGTFAPLVAATEPAVAGVILMAGGAQPMYRAALRQVRYLATLNAAGASDELFDTLRRQADLVDGPELDESTPDSALPFGIPAPYWLDLRGYDPVGTAAALARPILVLQGARDYQVTVAEDLAAWRAGLAGRADVTVRIYEPDNHLFFPGIGPATPAEYDPAQHVDPAVIDDIAAWLTTTRRS